MIWRWMPAISPPQKQDHGHGDNQGGDVEALHGSQQGAPMLPEKVSGAGYAGDPDHRTQEVVESKRSQAHAQHTGQRSGENADAENETGKENGGGAVAGEHALAAFHHGRRDTKEALIAIEQWTPAMEADGVAQFAAEGGGAGGNHDDPAEMELVFVIGQETSQQERELTGNGNAGALRQQCQSYGPVTVVGDECAQPMKRRGVHEFKISMNQYPVPSTQSTPLF